MNDNQMWDESHLLEIVNLGESYQYEFKGSKVIDLTKGVHDINHQALAKALSALANSGGGYLIIGINDKTRQVDDGGVNIWVKENGTKEWLEDILPPLVDPPLTKINVFEIKSKNINSQIKQDHAVYVIKISDSPLAPHQSSSDNKYYGRVSGKSHPLGDRMIRDIINRRQYPNIEISFKYGFVNDDDPDLALSEGQHPILIIYCRNTGSIYAKYVNVILHIPKYLLEAGATRSTLKGTDEVLDDGLKYIRVIRENVNNENFSLDGRIISRNPGRYVPVLPGQVHNFTIPLCEKFEDFSSSFLSDTPLLEWELYADNAPRKEGRICFQSIMRIRK